MASKGLDFSRMNVKKTRESLKTGGRVVYKRPGYELKGRTDMNNYTDGERAITRMLMVLIIGLLIIKT